MRLALVRARCPTNVFAVLDVCLEQLSSKLLSLTSEFGFSALCDLFMLKYLNTLLIYFNK